MAARRTRLVAVRKGEYRLIEDFVVPKGKRMTALLEQAIDKLRELPSTEQDAMAAIILDELADEDRWDAAFARSQDRLAEIAEQVRADIGAGRTRDIGIDEL